MKKVLFSSILISILATTAVADVLLRTHVSEDGRQERVQLLLENTPALRTADVSVSYDPRRQSLAGFRIGEDARGALVAINNQTPGLVRIAIASPREFAGVAPLGELVFVGTGTVKLLDSYVFTREEDEALIAYKVRAFVAPVCAAELGDVDLNTRIEQLDASRILDAVVGKVTLSTAEACRADVTMNGAVTAYDAATVLQAVAGQCFGLPSDFLPSARAHSNCIPTTVSSSPSNGEGEVAVTRETIIRFSNPLAAATAVTADVLYAEFGGQRLSARIHVAPDRKTATLFYNNDLPPSARVRVTVNGDLLRDALGDPIDADEDRAAGGIGKIDFDTLTLTVLAGTRVCGRVFASEVSSSVNTPLQGVRISVDGMDLSLRVDTDANGNFCLDPAPVGMFFVHIDGKTATNQIPQGAYYPTVGKAWESKAGQTVNIGEVYLPLIAPGTLQPVSTTQDTTIKFPPSVIAQNPAFADVKIVVPADSLYSETGARGGLVGMAPVPPDRIPSPLPPGLKLPVVITVQTDGATDFDRPVPVCFPNLPDPETGQPLPANTKSALFSYNHDTGKWEVVGPMTVSSDGKLVCSDAGSGIRTPGWHGTQPGNGEGGDSNKNKKEDVDAPPDTCDESGIALDVAGVALGIAGIAFAATLGAPALAVLAVASLGVAVAQAVHSGPDAGTAVDAVDFALNANPHHLDPAYPYLSNVAREIVDEPLLTSFPRIAKVGKGFGKYIPFVGIAFDGVDLGKLIAQCIFAEPPPKFDAWRPLNQQYANALEPTTQALRQMIGKKLGTLPISRKALVRAEKGNLVIHEVDGDPYLDSSGKQMSVPIRDLIDPQWLADPVAAVASLNAMLQSARDVATVFSSGNPTYREFEEELKAVYARATTFISSVSDNPSTARIYIVTDSQTGRIILRDRSSPSGRISFIAPTDRFLVVEVFDPATFQYGIGVAPSPEPGRQIEFPKITTFPDRSPDTDQDGLGEQSELVIGTDPKKRDTDGDGISDGAEIQQGTNPLDNIPSITGIIASVDTPGTALDVTAFNNVAAVADGDRGIAILNVFNSQNPTIIAQVGTPGTAQAVALDGTRVAVADGPAGLAIIEASDPPAARIVHQVSLAGSATAVAAAGGVAYVGTSSGIVAAVELATGSVLDQLGVSTAAIEDVGISGDTLYANTVGEVFAIPLNEGTLRVAGSAPAPGSSAGGRLRLFAGDKTLYAVHATGYSTYNITNPLQPVLIATGTTAGQFGWKQIVDNGSGTGIAAVAGDVILYDVRNPSVTTALITRFPIRAAAVSIYNGLAFLAGGDAGLQVVNYLPNDNRGVAPTITLATNFASGLAEEGKLMRLTASVTDDVQVRNVEFYVDGVLAATDGNFPFEHRFITPLLSQTSSFTIRARAVDTGGNATSTADRTITLTADATAPAVRAVTPKNGSVSVPGTVKALSVTFSEPMKQSSLTTNTILLFSAGADGVAGTADDSAVPGGTVSYLAATNTALLAFAAPLPDGAYRGVVKAAVSDLLGNQLGADFAWTFKVGSRTVRWISQTSGFWHEGARWDVGTPPQTDDIVIIDVPTEVTVTYLQGTTSILKLDSNEGLILGGGTLRVTGPVQVNNIFKLAGGTLADATIRPGTGGQSLTFLSGAPQAGTLSGVTIEGSLTVGYENFSTFVDVSNGLTVNGTLKLGMAAVNSGCGGSSTGSLRFNGTQNLQGTGTVVFVDPNTNGCSGISSSSIDITVPGTLVIAPGLTIHGGPGYISGTFINQGLISSDLADQQIGIGISGTNWSNGGTIEAKNGGGAVLDGSWSNSGTVSIAGGGTLALNGTFLNTGTISSTDSTVNLGASFTQSNLGTFNRTGGNVNLIGRLNNAGQTLTLNATTGSWRLEGGEISGGTLLQSGGAELIFTTSGVLDGLTVDGDLNLSSPDSFGHVAVTNGLTLNGTLKLGTTPTGPGCTGGSTATLTFFGTQTLQGTGTTVMLIGCPGVYGSSIDIFDPGTLTIAPQVTIQGGGGSISGTMINQGLISSDLTGQQIFISGTNWANSGTIEAKNGGSVGLGGTFTNSGLIKPGIDPGVIDVSDGYKQDSAGTLHIDLSGLTAGTEHSQLRITSGGAVFGGTLETALLGTYSPNVGDSFTVVTYVGGHSGAFAISGSPGAGKAWQADYGSSVLVLTVVSSP